jgi:Tfp pilus assembly protein PilF
VDPEQYYVFEVLQTREQASQAPGGLAKTGAVAQQFELERRALECKAAIRHNPDNEGAHFELALFLASRGKALEAAKQFSEVLRINPDNGSAHLGLATLLVRIKKRAEAVSHYRAAVRLMPESDRAREGLAIFLATNKDLQEPTPKALAPDLR